MYPSVCAGHSNVIFNVTAGYNGACTTGVAFSSGGSFFTSSGVTSYDGARLYVGNSQNSVLFFDVGDANVINDVSLGASGGIVGSPAVAPVGPGEDLIVVVSGLSTANGL